MNTCFPTRFPLSHLLGLVFITTASVSDIHAAQYLVEIQASSGPNQYGSPSYADYKLNAMSALKAGNTQAGADPAVDPTGYRTFTNGQTIDAGYAVVSSFKSWMGQANPTGAFSSELGNRLKFGVRITTTGGAKFGLADVAWGMTSVDKNNVDLTAPTSGTLYGLYSDKTYDGTTRYGIDWGPDGLRGTADDTIYESGEAGTIQVNELVYFGLGRAWDEDDKGGTEQEKLDRILAYIHGSTTTATFTIGGESTSSSVILEKVPEPSSVLLLSLSSVLLLRRKRNV